MPFGSPPTTEGVRWFVLKKTVLISRRQIGIFDPIYYESSRPIQPLNSRFILSGR